MGTQPSTPKGAEPHPIFVPRLLWPNGCMDQDATWYLGRPRPTRHCVRCGPAIPPEKGTPTPTQFLAHVCCGQMAGWMKTPLGTEVDLSSGHIVLDGVPAPAKGAEQPPPLFSAHVYCVHGPPSQLLLSSRDTIPACDRQTDRRIDGRNCRHAVQNAAIKYYNIYNTAIGLLTTSFVC